MVFVDTGAFIARYLAQDAFHASAAATWKTLVGRPLFTSNHVLDETLTMLGRRAGYGFAADRGEAIYHSKSLQILYSTREDESHAIRMFRKFADQNVSFTDCISFVLMKRSRIIHAFTYDRHFAEAGFQIIVQSELH